MEMGILLLVGILMPASNLIEMTPNLIQVTCSHSMLVQSVERVPNKKRLRILQLNKSTS